MSKPPKPAALLVTFMLLLFPQEGYAYLDSGSRSLVVQAILAAFFALTFTIKLNWRRIKGFLTNAFSQNRQLEQNDEETSGFLPGPQRVYASSRE